MSNFVLSCCSTADLSKEHFERRNISYICFHYWVNGKEYADDLGISLSFPEFYTAMDNHAETKTSQISVGEYAEYFESFLKQGMDVLHVTLSSGLSGTINSAEIAAKMLSEKYPERKMYVVDSLCASSGYGMLMDELADRRDHGAGIDELYEWTVSNRLLINHWFFSSDLTHYIRGGRVSKTSGFIGNLLGICLLLKMDGAGKLRPIAKVKSKVRTMRRLVDCMEEYADGGIDYSGKCYISHSHCGQDADKVAELIHTRFQRINGAVLKNYVGTAIGSHTGPGTVALFFWGKKARS